jgi:N-glycosidase YbiA
MDPNRHAIHFMKLTLDTDSQVFFYEQDFYVLSNFSAFSVNVFGQQFPTAEHAYQWKKFCDTRPVIGLWIMRANSAHEAFKLAQQYKVHQLSNWNEIRVEVMRMIFRAKVEQHEYVRRKLLATGDRELVENSWRDDFWGWGENRRGRNMLGKLWMEIRSELIAAQSVRE